MAIKKKIKAKEDVVVSSDKTPKVSVSFYFERDDDEFGFDRVVVTDYVAIRTLQELEAIEMQIRAMKGKNYTKVSVMSWFPLEN